MKYEIKPCSVPGTHGRMLSKTQFEVRELVPSRKVLGLFEFGRRTFKGSFSECEKWISDRNYRERK